jgi:uncharacterized iron-regulated membrane protein
MPYLLVGLAVALGLVFGVSAWSKVRSVAAQRRFAASLRPLLPDGTSAAVAVAVTVAELAVALGLSGTVVATLIDLPGARTFGLGSMVVAGSLCSALALGVAVGIRRRISVRCACFGAVERPLSGRHVVRNAILLLTAVGGLVTVVVGPTAPVATGGAMLSLFSGALAALVLIRLDDVIDLFTPAGHAGPFPPAS